MGDTYGQIDGAVARTGGTLLFDHDLAGAPELQVRVSAVPPEQLADLDRSAVSDEPVPWPTTVAPDAVSSPLLQYGQQHTLTLPPGTYTTALFDRDGNQAGLAFMTRVAPGAPADPPVTVATMWMLTNLEPGITPPATGSAPPAGSPAAALLDAGQIGVNADLVDAAPVRFWIAPAGRDAGAPAPEGLLSPLLGPGRSWKTLVPAGDYRVTAWNEHGIPVWGETTVSVADRSDPLHQHGGVTSSQLRNSPPNSDPTRTPPG